MIFEDKSILYLNRNNFQIYQGTKLWTFNFPQAEVNNLEVLDAQKFQNSIQQFFKINKLANLNLQIILGESVYFKKQIDAKPNQKQGEAIQKFLDEVPMDSSKIAYLIYSDAKTKIAIATNRLLYETIINALKVQDSKVDIVAPIFIFNVIKESSDLTLNPQELKTIVNNLGKFRQENFLTDSTSEQRNTEGQEKEETQKYNEGTIPKTTKLPYVLIAILLIIAAASSALIYFKRSNLIPLINKMTSSSTQVQNPPTSQEQPIENQATQSAESTKSAIDRSTPKIRILNGTGSAGLAAKVQDSLKSNGFTNSEIGNTQKLGEVTVISFSNQVSKEIQVDIITLLEETFARITTQEPTANQNVDILITTGKLK